MGSLRVTVCTSVLAAVALAPAAYAADEGSVSATPAIPAPGSDVTLHVTGCAQRTATAASAAFVANARLTVTGAGELAGESRVRSTIEAGSYAVRVTCGTTTRTGTLTVRDGEAARPGAASLPVPAGGQQPAHGDVGHQPAPDKGGQQPAPEGGGQPSAPGGDPEAFPSHRPGAPASPVAPVRAGGGGAAELIAAEERGAGPGAAQGMTGLVLAGVAAAVIVVLRRGVRRGRGTD
ncbi:hypothetical protein GCM10010103_17710 [Streptomyces paradoxus]|uniref:Lipoprotein n=1 Tax=Streptomyces paradoxus TaxID=66375 RepID=A0A7W9WG88_9ACTN|nr:hypothetical protein [Streptomyces paradoxus]MBB6075874.1 hypothetical protein [Streptomyces paradoxus]